MQVSQYEESLQKLPGPSGGHSAQPLLKAGVSVSKPSHPSHGEPHYRLPSKETPPPLQVSVPMLSHLLGQVLPTGQPQSLLLPLKSITPCPSPCHHREESVIFFLSPLLMLNHVNLQPALDRWPRGLRHICLSGSWPALNPCSMDLHIARTSNYRKLYPPCILKACKPSSKP